MTLGLSLAFSCLSGGELRAEEPSAREAPSPPKIDIDRLFEVPKTALPRTPLRRGGRDREGWQDAFERARGEIEQLAGRIDETEAELHAFVQPATQFSPLGGAARSDPKVVKLRQQLERDRQSLETARRRLRDLDIEAALAGVPRGWRESLPGPTPSSATDEGR